MQKKPHNPHTIKELYHDLSPEEQTDADYNMKRYVNLVWKIYNRLKDEGKLDEVLQEIRERDHSRK